MWQTVLKISRPRFWIYLLGPFTLASAYIFFQLQKPIDWTWFVWFLFWTFPANLWIYGVNDIADRDTDAFNPKKSKQEHRLNDKDTWLFWMLIGVLVGIGLLFVILDRAAQLWFLLWFFLGTAYSLPPFRFKVRPFLDSYSNVLYALPAFVTLWQWGRVFPSWWIFVSVVAWNAAMHAFSAIPDIQSDKKAGLATVATVLGRRGGLYFCAVNWILPGLLLGWFIHPLWLFSCTYAVVPLFVMKRSDEVLSKVYWLMPWINAGVGGLLFWILVCL